LPLDVHIYPFACIAKGSAGIPAVPFVDNSLDRVLELQQFGHVENVDIPGKQIINLLCVVLFSCAKFIRMPRLKSGPLVGIVGNGLRLSISPRSIDVLVGKHKLDLSRAPRDKDGIIEIIEIRDDGMVWATGVLYFDPATGTYFPDPNAKRKSRSSDSNPSKRKRMRNGKQKRHSSSSSLTVRTKRKIRTDPGGTKRRIRDRIDKRNE
jgi:hypothetical protein